MWKNINIILDQQNININKFVFEEKLQITTTEKDKEIEQLKAAIVEIKPQQKQDQKNKHIN